MIQEYVLTLADPRAALENTGGKGASLARLAAAGLPVPGGFHMITEAYRQFVNANDLQPRIQAALQAVDLARPDTLETASSAIAALFAQARMPDEIASAAARAYSELPGEDPAVAVRSSATAEDLPELSFAGQQETFLNIRGVDALLDAIKRCWASLWTARAIGYRAQHDIDQDTISLAVVVQMLVPARAAGILFTANPVNGQRGQAMITATWGLGEAIVGGMVTPDTLTIEKATGKVIQRETADKEVMTVRTERGTQEQPAPEALRHTPVLSDEQAAELTRLGVKIEELYGLPVDIEWALDESGFAIVQARPITALPEPELPTPTEWLRENPKAQYYRSSLAEHLPNPVTPLFGTLGLNMANMALTRLLKEIFGSTGELYQYGTINGYVFLGGIVMNLKTTLMFTRVTFAQMGSIFSGSAKRWQAARREFERVVTEWEAKPVEDLPPSELLEGVRQVMFEAGRFYTMIQSGTLPTASSSELLFGRVYKMVKREGDPEAATLLFGSETIALRAEKSLFDLAAWAGTQPALRDHLLRAPSARLAASLRDDQQPNDVSAADWAEFKARFDKYIDEFGHTSYEYDFANPTPAETPEPLLDAIKMYLEGRGSNPYERQREALEKRERVTQDILSRRMWFPKSWFKQALHWAQETGPLREDSIFDMTRGHPVVRRMLGELGRRFAAGGAIHNADDIYWLVEDEVNELAALLEKGQPLPDYSERMPQRKAEWRAQLKANPPAMLPTTSRLAKLMPLSRENETGSTLKGLGTSAGKVTARAAVLFGPEEFNKMKPGDVLVAVTTTPAWTPLFTMASAVVTDIGGPLSHSSIVAREYGIPAVMATGNATRRIRSGDRITVDGSAGLVILHEDGESA